MIRKILRVLLIMAWLIQSAIFITACGWLMSKFVGHNIKLNSFFATAFFSNMIFGSLVLYSPFEKSMCWIKGWRNLEIEENQLIEPILKELLVSYKQKYLRSLDLDNLNIRINNNDNQQINAFAFSRSTIVINKTLLLKLKRQEIKAVLAHELGHIHARDSIIGGILEYSYLPAYFLQLCFVTLFHFIASLINVLNYLKLGVISLILIIVIKCIFEPVMKINEIILVFFNCIILANSRSNEYKADAFACSLGCYQGLKCFLTTLKKEDNGNYIKVWWKNFWSTHPCPKQRLLFIDNMNH